MRRMSARVAALLILLPMAGFEKATNAQQADTLTIARGRSLSCGMKGARITNTPSQ
jgi:hypothetical protein